MASSKGGKSASNVMSLDDARKKRKHCQEASADSGFSIDGEPAVAAVPQSIEQNSPDSSKSGAKAPSKPGNRSFDREKVDRIKGEIARGEYKINYFEVADKYIEHERFS